ncbi:1016_t:CDS:2 [Acaulospora colombiana]|uniref:1016_t:CDS:1 n=1 Tax=Acaulospora colombiana TaxID=27376 RepID=A0ACA9K7Y1_9GLOM|nr:1016_t:CDS:2 [Acaulospora colombiana]
MSWELLRFIESGSLFLVSLLVRGCRPEGALKEVDIYNRYRPVPVVRQSKFRQTLRRVDRTISGSRRNDERTDTRIGSSNEAYLENKTFYFETLALYNAVQQVILQKELRKDKISDSQRKALEATRNVLSFAETKQYLGFRAKDPSMKNENPALLGLTEEKLKELVEKELEELNTSKEYILTSIENKLKKQCEEIAKFYYIEEVSIPESNPKLLFAKAIQLNKKLSQRVDNLRLSKIHAITSKSLLGEQIVNYMNVMKEILSNSWSILEEFKLQYEFKKNRVFCDYFSGIVKSMVLKFRVLRFTALLSIYDKDTVEGLEMIRDNLLNEEIKKRKELDALESELSKYQICDEFESIVQIYAEVNKEIEKVKDDIQRMNEQSMA